MKFEILSFVADAVLLLLILFMFCHFVRLSALSFSLSHSFRFNNIYNITNGGQTRVPREGECLFCFLKGIGNICAFCFYFFRCFVLLCCL